MKKKYIISTKLAGYCNKNLTNRCDVMFGKTEKYGEWR